LNYDNLYYPYPSRRMAVYANNGIVATSQILAAQAGLEILKKGGNAIDAAIATAACLTVVEPPSNGVGGDAFALVWTEGKLYGLNSSGPAPKSISAEIVRKAGYDEMPEYGWIPVTVPGAPAAWAELAKRFGKLPLVKTLEPAIRYAGKGYPVSPCVAKFWGGCFNNAAKILKHDQYTSFFETFGIDGNAPKAGHIWRCKDLSKTLISIAETYSESFYRGNLADKIHAFSKKYGGYISGEDLEDYKPEWVDPISINYRGYDVWEIPPNGQGLVALMALNILKGFEFHSREDPNTCHKQLEAMKLAFADGNKYITDSKYMNVKVKDLLSESYAEERRKLIGNTALEPVPGQPMTGGTVYLASADGQGNMISYIQSNYKGFGSGLVVPGTGIALQNRGKCFSLNPDHVNCLEPGKRSYHTIIPGFLTKAGKPVGPFGVMGGFMQPQGHVQVIMNTVDFKLNPQAALDAPRWQWLMGKSVTLERTYAEHIAGFLERKGHGVRWALEPNSFGRGQIIWKEECGVLCAGTDPRTDGAVAAW
jgi:gamma-glutamyltranspeptidase/glutathione hydrolase